MRGNYALGAMPRGKALTIVGVAVAVVIVMVFGVLLVAAKPAHAKTFTVNYKGDSSDWNPADGICDTTSSPFQAPCSLRAAIQQANAFPGPDVINFNIPNDPNIPGNEVKSIKPTKELPVISDQVTINGYSQPGASPNTKAVGNDAVLKIELDGTNAGAGTNGLRLTASNSVVKGLVINRFKGFGVILPTSDIKVEGNFIGTDAGGTLDRGNSLSGVYAPLFSSNNQIGGTTPEARNIISGNGEGGVRLSGSENEVLGNFIGTKKNGTGDLGNSANGVTLAEDPDDTVGGNTAASANVIAFNGEEGVAVFGSTGNSILRNSIFSNGGLGIDLKNDGVTANDPQDPDTGPNGLQNYPFIASATTSGGTTTIKGALNSTPNKSFTLRFFSSPQADPSGFGEGKNYLGTKSVTTSANGSTGIFTFTPNQVVPVGQKITATATNAGGNTSEFSGALEVVVP
jgi:hypothetical protein